MFFKPNYCCNCGEKINRAEWGILTSRRFCSVCAVENQGHEWAVRALVGASLLIGLFGFGSYLRTPGQPQYLPVTAGLIDGQSGGRTATAAPAALKRPEQLPSVELADGVPLNLQGPPAQGPAGASKEQLRHPSSASDQPVYFCGAMTKKGKPCSRRVKTKGRCWQHTGQPSALEMQPAPDMY